MNVVLSLTLNCKRHLPNDVLFARERKQRDARNYAMCEQMVHFVGGPADGLMEIMDEKDHPFAVSMSTDTDGYYGLDYQVAGQHIGDLELTSDDVIARWHQRSSAIDFMTGDTVIVIATGARANVFASAARINPDGTTDEGWMITVESNLIFVAAAEIRIATADELSGGGSPT